MHKHNVASSAHKKRLFKEIENLKSVDPELRKKGKLRILEVGCGAGKSIDIFHFQCLKK
jgi:hypothetical protein